MAYCTRFGDSKHDFSTYLIPLLPLAFSSLKTSSQASGSGEDSLSETDSNANTSNRILEAEVAKGFRYSLADISASCLITYGNEDDITRVLNALSQASKHEQWQIRQVAAHYVRCFQGCHKFLFSSAQTNIVTDIVVRLLADERREVSSAATAALTGIIAGSPPDSVAVLVKKFVQLANASVIKRKKKGESNAALDNTSQNEEKERERARQQRSSVFFLCATVLASPYDTPDYVPAALAALSKHSFERSAPLAVREAVKLCCSEYKKKPHV